MKKQFLFKRYNIYVILLLTFFIATLTLISGITIGRSNTINKYTFSQLCGESDRVILFIGDGMGEAHLKVTEKYFDKELYLNSFSYKGKVSTFSKTMFLPTDSAASATALSTGTKVCNGAISRNNGIDIATISEYAVANGKGVGIVTTDSLNGATPAAFSSHANNRGDTKAIIKNQLESNINIFLGGGKNTYASYEKEFTEKGYTFINNIEELIVQKTKIIGTFDEAQTLGNDILSTMALFAVEYLEANFPDGYFLLIEGAHIDKMSHKNEIIKMVSYLSEFDKAVEKVDSKLTNTSSYTIIVTADHETGGLVSNGETKSNITNKLYRTKGHTSKDVCYYVKAKLKNKKEIELPKKIDNTDIFKMTYQLLICKEEEK